MKRINCEICGGAEMIKDNGVFVCQSCGCKYSLEEVRKMLIDDAPSVQLNKVSSSDGQTEKYKNILKATRDAMDDGRFDSAYTNSIQLIAMKPDVPELIAIQALAIFGKDKMAFDIPSSTIKGMDRFYSLFDTWKAEGSERVATIKNVQKYVGIACQAQYDLLQETISELESQKYTSTLADNLGALGDALGMLGGSFYSTVQSMGRERDDRRRSTDNQIIDQQIKKIQDKAQKIDKFKRQQVDRLSTLFQVSQKAIIEAKQQDKADTSSQEGNEDINKYKIINDKEIMCNKCGSVQSIRRKNGVCWMCGVRFSD